MTLERALRILEIVRCQSLGYARNLSYTPTRQEIAEAIELIEKILIPER